VIKRLSKLHYGIIEKPVKEIKAHQCALVYEWIIRLFVVVVDAISLTTKKL
jgi:hypothetical protein